jgi:DNA-binding CsgD family transcriptional regulator
MDAMRLLVDLQKISVLAQSFSGCLDPQAIARSTTDRLVEQFGCALARIWLVSADRTTLNLVASSGMYTRIDGSFARVPMGAFKVGKIAQNRIPFLSNNLPNEVWVKDRDWAIANQIRGFAGYPLVVQDQVLGVLVTFSRQVLEPEFLEVLQTLCSVVSISIHTALQYQIEKQTWQVNQEAFLSPHLSLSEHLVRILRSTRLNLLGTERSLALPVFYLFLQAAEIFNQLDCAYCRLIYGEAGMTLEAIVPIAARPTDTDQNPSGHEAVSSLLLDIDWMAISLGGRLQTHPSSDQTALQMVLSVPYRCDSTPNSIRIQCQRPLLQQAFIQLARAAGLAISSPRDSHSPLLTDHAGLIPTAPCVLWVRTDDRPLPKGIQGKVDLTITPAQLQQAVVSLQQNQPWGLEPAVDIDDPIAQSPLSGRELEILQLLTQGCRDRDIADHLIISESTVKFHMNNVLAKLKARTRYQAIHQATQQGWL